MPFESFEVQTPEKIKMGTGLSCSLKRLKTGPAQMALNLRPSVAAELGLADKTKLRVMVGSGEHHGLLRFTKDEQGSAVVLERVAGDGEEGGRGGPYFTIRLGHMPAFINRSEAKRWCVYELLDGGVIEVVLPSWADETGPNARKRAPADPPPEEPTPADRRRRLMGDPPPGRSALDVTRGDAHRMAERREAPAHASAEARDQRRQQVMTNQLARLAKAFGSTPAESRLLHAMLDGQVKTKEVLLNAIAPEVDTAPEIKMIDVLVSKMRKKLAMRQVEITTHWGTGYQLEPRMAAKVKALFEGDVSEPAD